MEAIIILLETFSIQTDISVTLILNKNKKAQTVEQNGVLKRYRNRERNTFYGFKTNGQSLYEKKYIELTDEDRTKVTSGSIRMAARRIRRNISECS